MRYFFAESLKRGQYIDELKELFEQLELGTFRDSGSTVGALHRTWARIKFKFTDSDFALLVTAEQGEIAIAELYEKVVRAHLPICIRKILTPQARHIRMVHSYVKFARDRASIGPAQPHVQKLPIQS